MELLEEWTAREKIRDILHLYCEGIDRRNWPLVRACFADDHVHSHGAFSGTADEFIAFARTVLASIPATHHNISNVHITLADDGLSAESQANFVAYHRIEAGHESNTPVPTQGKATDWIVAGRYCDRFEKRSGKWIIVKREAVHDWERVDEASV